MALWTNCVDLIGAALQWLASDLGLGLGLAIVLLTLAARALLLPITWTAAYRGLARRRKLAELGPELERLKAAYSNNPQRLLERTLELYARHGLKLFDPRGLLGALAQMPVVLGVFQCLRDSLGGGRFLWVANLAKPDFALAILAGLSTALLMALAPEMPEQMRQIMLWVPCVVMIVLALQFSSGLALYWATSNLVGAAQATTVRAALARRERTGA